MAEIEWHFEGHVSLYLLVVRLKTNQTFSFATKHKEKEKKWNKFKSLFVLSHYLDCSVWTNDQLREIWMFLPNIKQVNMIADIREIKVVVDVGWA